MEKTANQLWKESGSTLTFKEWIDRENKKKDNSYFLSFDSTEVNPDDIVREELQKLEDKPREREDKTKILGLDKNILIYSSVLIVGSLIFYLVRKAKNKK